MTHRMPIFLIFSLVFFAAFSYGASSESVISQWNNEEGMRPYYVAISKFRQVFEECRDQEKERVGNGFKDWPEPNPFYYRSPKYLFLETSEAKEPELADKTRGLSRLHTPFGEVKIFGSGWSSAIRNISKNILHKMESRWILEEVTDKVKCRNFFFDSNEGEEQSKDYLFRKESWKGAGDKVRLFLIKSIDDIVLVRESPDSLVIFPSVSLDNGEGSQYDKGKALFRKLSDGKEHF